MNNTTRYGMEINVSNATETRSTTIVRKNTKPRNNIKTKEEGGGQRNVSSLYNCRSTVLFMSSRPRKGLACFSQTLDYGALLYFSLLHHYVPNTPESEHSSF